MRRTVRRFLIVVALACFGLLLIAGVAAAAGTVEGQNDGSNGLSTTGSAVGTNTNGLSAGATASGADDSEAQQSGDNSLSGSQKGTGKTGDGLAGSQVTGGIGDLTVQNQNHADDNLAVSGTTVLTNVGVVGTGPSAFSEFGDALASQMGDNLVSFGQDIAADTGDAVAGSQITGIADADIATVQNQNSATDNVALSGVVSGVNLLVAGLGPTATADIFDASASQVGDNDLVLEQASTGFSGDAVAGSQNTGIVGSGSSFTVQMQNNSSGSLSTSGVVSLTNALVAAVGPAAFAFFDGQSAQTGDNTVVVDQSDEALSGDAISGSQVTGLVAEENAHLHVQNQQASEDDIAITGIALADNTAVVTAGPRVLTAIGAAQAAQTGDNSVTIGQVSSATSGDANASSQITGLVAGFNAEIVVELQNSTGSPIASAFSGNAVSGSQVTGIVSGAGSDVTLQAQNEASGAGGPIAFADFSLGTNSAFVDAGPDAFTILDDAQAEQIGDNAIDVNQVTNDANSATLAAGPSSFTVLGDSQASQTGDDDVGLVQEAVSGTGDAVSGSQVSGVVTGDGSTTLVELQNHSTFAIAITGDIPVTNDAAITAGPTAETVIGDAQASQLGDVAVAADQTIDASTGDAVSGSQVVGTVGGDRTHQVQNSSDFAIGTTGIPSADNHADGSLGPIALTVLGESQSQTDGDTDLGLGQLFSVVSGDAVVGTQIVGTVA